MSQLASLLTGVLSTSPVLLLLALLVIGYLVVVWATRRGDTNPDPSHPQPPGPWPLPLLGNLLQLTKKPHQKLTLYQKQYGDVYQIMMGSRPTIILNGLDTVWRACVKQADDFAGRPDFYTFKLIGNGNSMGFGNYGKRWKMHRRIAQNAISTFANKRVNPIEGIIASEADVLVNQLLKEGRKPFNPHNEIYLSVGNIICAICFGKRYQRDDPDFLRLVELNDQFMAYAAAGNPVDIMPWTRPLLTRSLNNFTAILDIMNKFCEKKQREHLETYSSDVMRDVTDILIRTVKETPEEEKEEVGLTDEHILTTVQELIGAGFDTISSTLQWAVLYLMTHTHVQDRAHDEIRRVVGTERAPELGDLPHLAYTEAVMLEVMRHSCIFPLALPHSTTRDTVLNGYFIPKDTLVLINLWSVVRDGDAFADPERFYPDRFLEDNDTDGDGNVNRKTSEGNEENSSSFSTSAGKGNQGGSSSPSKSQGKSGLSAAPKVSREMAERFLPYGAGRRRCPGEQLARMEIFLFLATLIQRCRFTVPEGRPQPSLDSKYGLTLKPQDFHTCVTARPGMGGKADD